MRLCGWSGGTGAQEVLVPRAATILGNESEQATRMRQVALSGDHFLAAVYRTGEPFLGTVPLNGTDSAWRTAIACPLEARSRRLGVLAITNRRSGDFEAGHLSLLRAIASPVAARLENTQLFTAERERADLMALVNQISRGLTATLSLSDLAGQSRARYRTSQFDYETVHLALLDEAGQCLTVAASYRCLHPRIACPMVSLAAG